MLPVYKLSGCFVFLLWFSASFSAFAQSRDALGLVLHAEAAQVQRSGFTTALTLGEGDLLFEGDAVQAADNGQVEFLFCPASQRASLSGGSRIRFNSKDYRPAKGVRILERTPICLLPRVQTDQQISLRTFGATLFSDVRGTDAPATFQPSPADQEQLKPLDTAIQTNGRNLVARIARGATLAKLGFNTEAAKELAAIGREWPAAAWALPEADRLAVSETRGTVARTTSTTGEGKIFALVVGISKYTKATPLGFAAEDAESFAQFLMSPRGGAVPRDNITLLKDEKATRSGIETGFKEMVARAGPKDAVWILLAAHGVVLDKGPQAGAYILAVDTSAERPEDGFPMAFVESLLTTAKANVRRMDILVDACHAGAIGQLHSNRLAVNVGNVMKKIDSEVADADVFAMLASGQNEVSNEGPAYGGGHGVFTYFVLKGMNGDAPSEDNQLTRIDLFHFVAGRVKKEYNSQHPTVAPASPKFETVILPDTRPERTGIVLPDMPRRPELTVVASNASREITKEQSALEKLLSSAAAVPPDPASAVRVLNDLKSVLDPIIFASQKHRLQVTVEDRAAAVLDIYLQGNEVNQTSAQFQRCADYLDTALALTPESAPLRSKRAFCEGRVKVFEKLYPEAIAKLEEAVRLDPLGSWSYNGLGIAWLEMAEYEKAGAALRDAIRISPYWAYPRHNLALVQRELGDYDAAIATYREACRLAAYAYLRYNLGFIYQRVNQPEEARLLYEDAHERAPGMAKPLIGLGLLEAQRGKEAAAIRQYDAALKASVGGLDGQEDRMCARHNKALLLVRSPGTFDQAIELWTENTLDKKDDPGPFTSMGDAFAGRSPQQNRDQARAAVYYRQAWDRAAKSTAIASRLIAALIASQDLTGALVVSERAAARFPGDPLIAESLGDAQAAAHRLPPAIQAYNQARSHAVTGPDRKRIARKIAGLSRP